MAQNNLYTFSASAILAFTLLTSCSVNPFRTNNELTGTAAGTAVGAGAGAGVAALAGASKAQIAGAAIIGGLIGYYVTSLSFRAGGITHVGGQVFTVGDYVTIEIPANMLFDVNTADFLPQAGPILDSAVSVLNRYPSNNIMVSGNSSGFYTAKFEQKLTEARARQVAAYLWAHGINDFDNENTNYASLHGASAYSRKLSYVGYGNYFPIANNITREGVAQNSRIQITAYPKKSHLYGNKCERSFMNIGNPHTTTVTQPQPQLAEPGNTYHSETLSETRYKN